MTDAAPLAEDRRDDASVVSEDIADARTEADEPTVALAPGRRLVASRNSHHVFRFGVGAFLVGSVLFSLQFLAWNVAGVFVGSLINVALLLVGTIAFVAIGAVTGRGKRESDRFWDQALIRGMLAFYLMAAIAVLAGGGKIVFDLIETRRIRYVVQERFGFSATERIAIDGERTVDIVTLTDVDPSGPFAKAGLVPGQSIVTGGSADDFYARLGHPDAPSTTLTVVSGAAGSNQSIAPDVAKLPRRSVLLPLQVESD